MSDRNEFLSLVEALPAWVTTADGEHVTRDEYADRIREGVADVEATALEKLAVMIEGDPRKSFGKRAVLDLIRELQ